MIIRHPAERFASLYANIQQRQREPMNFYKQLEGLSPWDCFDKLIQLSPGLSYDFHFQPQSSIIPARPVHFVRLEDFAGWVAQSLPNAVPPKVLNASDTAVAIDDKTRDRVINRYKADFEFWEQAGSATNVAAADAA
jgi:hypothetical protein